jgi:DNA topoisomerase-1
VAGIVTDVLVEHFGDYVDVAFTARMEEELDEVARGERAWVPLLREFYDPLKALVDEKRRELRRRDLTTEETDEVCSEGHAMVIRLGRNGRFLACSLYPEHKETRPIPGEEEELPAIEGVGQPCPTCGEGSLVAKRGRYGVFAGCSRYPDCDYIHRTGPPPPPPLPFEVQCPTCGQGRLTARRARRTGNVFYGCSRYPACDFTTNLEPLGAVHDADAGAVALKDEHGLCLRCGASVDLPTDRTALPGRQLAGGPPDPGALAPSRKRRATGGNGARSPRTAGRTTKGRGSKAAPGSHPA